VSKTKKPNSQQKKSKLKKDCVKKATKNKLATHPKCSFCNNPADTCHHFIRQSRSNFLRCYEPNLVPICDKHHYLLHHGGQEAIMVGILIRQNGLEWFNDLEKKKDIRISDTIGYWEKTKSELEKQL
jgi:hypothetical protein